MVRVCDCREKEKELIKKKLQASKAHKDKVKQVRQRFVTPRVFRVSLSPEDRAFALQMDFLLTMFWFVGVSLSLPRVQWTPAVCGKSDLSLLCRL
jgi:hypothetical protein